MNHLVFVYGSLMSGLHNHRLLAGAESLGPRRTVAGDYVMLDLGAFPGVHLRRNFADDSPGTTILGELYRVDRTTLGRLDRLEGCPDFYYRTGDGVLPPHDQSSLPTEWAQMYLLSRPRRGAPSVPSGDWRACLAARGRKEVG